LSPSLWQFSSLQKDIDDHKDEIKKYQAEKAKLETIIRNLEKDILGLKKEIQERDDTIQDKVRSGGRKPGLNRPGLIMSSIYHKTVAVQL